MTDKALIIFIKNPAVGKVKTRLAATVGNARALAIYQKLTAITRQNAKLLRGVTCYLYYDNFINFTDEWSNKIFEKAAQKGGDLGIRMFHAFSDIFEKHAEAVIIGSDCPTLTAEMIEKAFDSLKKHDFVIGPATDGGYYLLGMTKGNLSMDIFKNIAWSTSTVAAETEQRIKTAKKTVSFLENLTDIDAEKDWNEYVQKSGLVF